MSRRSWQEQEAEADEAGDPCVRGTYCAGRRIVIEDGHRVIYPALTYSGFCTACRTVIGQCLGELPAAYDRLAAEIGEPVKRNSSVRTPLGPSLPLRADVDAVMHAIADELQSWEERVRDVARLSMLDTQTSRQRDTARAIRQSVDTLAPRLNVLFALAEEPMTRAVPVAGQPDDITLADLGGQDAGEEILSLHYRARAILGEITPRAETLDGVPCKRCEAMSLQRAEPPSDPALPAMWSQCSDPACRHQMSREDFADWASWYAKWAESAGVACRRCQAARHGECQWPACSCRASGHQLAALCPAA